MPGYQFKINLQDVQPLIWRRIVVPTTCTFADFEYAIMDSMGWEGVCITRFHIDKSLLMPDYQWQYFNQDIYYFNDVKDFLNCELEFEYKCEEEEDVLGWMHTIEYEGEVEFDGTISVCVDGERACPPDDLEFSTAYPLFAKNVADPESRLETLQKYFWDWYERLDYDVDVFDCSKVKIRLAKPLYN